MTDGVTVGACDEIKGCQVSACSVSNFAEIEPWAQVRMGDAWLQNKPYGVCDREIDHDDLGRWFRCASKV